MRCPVGKVRDALALHDAQSQRQRGLPHEVLVYFVLAMVLYASVAYEAEMGSYEQSELTLAGSVMAHADATMLITADRNFYSYAFWQQSLATGARLLFRLSSVLKYLGKKYWPMDPTSAPSIRAPKTVKRDAVAFEYESLSIPSTESPMRNPATA
ncbi:hypothetical protein HF925_03445 [Acidithiobacillus ferriphilus]|uniref:transposase domain-containing protein n=1 Tax=Acidithiobacillus ferriphilus TaxID=1689834 RepID=UPI001C06A5E6|nr:transposase domain-containing protein [Acidithiobacillus ferriphilus]MBU2847652.1 hypothetical protein [Acidithiobacillus ferriphilus]